MNNTVETGSKNNSNNNNMSNLRLDAKVVNPIQNLSTSMSIAFS